jgi:hypothetical protein
VDQTKILDRDSDKKAIDSEKERSRTLQDGLPGRRKTLFIYIDRVVSLFVRLIMSKTMRHVE